MSFLIGWQYKEPSALVGYVGTWCCPKLPYQQGTLNDGGCTLLCVAALCGFHG